MADKEHLAILERGVDEWNRWRARHPDLRPDLSDADLRAANLDSANLAATDLRRASLSGAQLMGADLAWADLREADLSRSDLSMANLSDANLANSDLSEARLTFSRLARSRLAGSDFAAAVFGRTALNTVDLSGARGLTSVTHVSPSPISVDTLFKSGGRIPEVFLRGCGLPEQLIEYLPALVAPPTVVFFSCFISYSHRDRSFARRLHDQLQARGIRCWLDEHQILPGDDLLETIDRGIRIWDKVVLCCSRTSLTSAWIDTEISKALAKERRLEEERGGRVQTLIPLNLDGFLFSEDFTRPYREQLLRRLAVDFTGWKRDNTIFERQSERVVRALQQDVEVKARKPREAVLVEIQEAPGAGDRFHIFPSEGRWALHREGAAHALKLFDSQRAALDRAKELAKQGSGVQVVVHRRDGTTRRRVPID